MFRSRNIQHNVITIHQQHPCQLQLAAWGFECGDGWYNLIDELSAKLEPHGVVAMQVKEKFGELRFYISEVPDDCMEDIYKHITEAEIKSLTTCEICGNEENASIRGERWLRTMCDECDKK